MTREKNTIREFGLSTLAINNKTSIFILTAIIVVIGFLSYVSMPKALYPEATLPNVYINAVYSGNSPLDIENLITRPIEKELKPIRGVKNIESTSAQDVSSIIIKFNEDVVVSQALQDVKDAVDKAKKDLPSDLDSDPTVLELDFSEIPIVNINLSGDFEIDQLKGYAEYLEDELETLAEVSKVDISGSVDREIQINADVHKMQAREISFDDIAAAIRAENIAISGGDVLIQDYRRSLRVFAEFRSVQEIADIIISAEDQNIIHLKDVAQVKDTYVERKSYARLATNKFLSEGSYPVVSLRVIKKSGENLINASKKIQKILRESKGTELPKNLNIILTEDQADQMKQQLSDLENSIISGVILVILVLLFFMGLRNAIFVGIAIPLSMFIAFMVLNILGITINIVVLFALILALGMLVDNAIVVIENIYRLKEQGFTNMRAAKEGVGEVAVAIISSTATTLAAFTPLAFWGGLMGKFMRFLPITLIVVLASSLFVGLVINPVIASSFIKVSDFKTQPNKKRLVIVAIALIVLAIPCYFAFDNYLLANILITFAFITLANAFIIKQISYWFQNSLLSRLEQLYLRVLRKMLKGCIPAFTVGGTFVFLVLAIVVFALNLPSTVLFPTNNPNYIYMYMEAPLGTDVKTTDRISEKFEKKVYEVLTPYKHVIDAIVINTGQNTSDPKKSFSVGGSANFTPHKSKISISFTSYEKRKDVSTAKIMQDLTEMSKGFSGVKIITDKDTQGPPVGKPVNIEVTGENYIKLIEEAEKIKALIEQSGITGLDGLSLDLEIGKPELMVNIDREKVRRYGASAGMIGNTLRTAIYGQELSKFKDGEYEYPIQLRLAEEYRYDIAALNNQRLTFRDKKGKTHQVPISALANLEYSSTFGSVKRKDLDRVIVVNANIIEGYNANKIVASIKRLLNTHQMPIGYSFKFTGEQQEQAEAQAFLTRAMAIAVASIFLILVSQFNSTIKPFIIVGSVIFSLIGVLLGLIIFRDDFVIIMTGVGIISLAGVVVNNAIVLIDYIDLVRKRKKKSLGLKESQRLNKRDLVECLVEGGYARLRPVLLTAITTVLGLIPLAIGLNIDFFGLYAHFNPHIYLGGPNAGFWGPMAWTVIYGLIFATFLTLLVVPTMYYLSDRIGVFLVRISGEK